MYCGAVVDQEAAIIDRCVFSFQVAEMYRSQVNSIKASSSSSNAATDGVNDDMY